MVVCGHAGDDFGGVAHDCGKLMIEHIVFACPFSSFLVGAGGVCESCCLWSSLVFASELWSLCLHTAAVWRSEQIRLFYLRLRIFYNLKI